jgi:uncharacterized membrane protein (DUF2068 family)
MVDRPRKPGEAGLRAIILYKAVRAAASAVGALVLGILMAVGADATVERFVAEIHEHAVHRVSLELSMLALKALEPRHVYVAIGALVLDTLMVALEGWSLHKRWWWGPWLVVVATAGLLPFEAIALVHRLSVLRAVVMLINLVILGYLVFRAWRHHQERVRSTLRNDVVTRP